MAMNLHVGDVAPLFSLSGGDGSVYSLADFLGRRVLLYFYPKDNTGGCTAEACALRDAFPDFTRLHITIFGISPDSVKSHAKFAEKHALPFILLADETHEVIEKYGVWGKKKFMGREYMGVFRASFLIGVDGKIEKIYENVKPESHAAEVLADLT